MKMHLLLVAGLSLLILTNVSEARSRGSVFTGGRGNTLTRDISGGATGSGYSRQAITTGPGGNTLTGNQNVTRNGNGSATVNGTYTTSTGKSATTSRLVTSTGNGHTSNGTITTGSGKNGDDRRERDLFRRHADRESFHHRAQRADERFHQDHDLLEIADPLATHPGDPPRGSPGFAFY